jgi:signal transduction histidine kinase/CheY-like chemotaxis protein
MQLTAHSTIGDLPCQVFEVSPTIPGHLIATVFEEQINLPGILVMDGPRFAGMVSRQKFYEHLGRPYGVALFMRRAIQELLDVLRVEPLILPYTWSIDEAVKIALNREPGLIYEPVIVEFEDFSLHLLDLHVLLLAQNQLLTLANSRVQEQKEAAESANRAKSQFLANMSHELRTPLNAIIGYSEMLQEEAHDLEQEEFIPDLQKIQKAGQHLLALINDILDLSKIEAGKMELYLETFEVSHMLQEVVSTVKPLVELKSNRLEIHLDDKLGSMHSDLTKVRQVLFNLLSNASKFTEQGTIRLEATRQPVDGQEYLRFKVTDTGIGMSPEQLGRLFQTFSQADASTTRKYGGTGLGLAISQKFCQMLNGDIQVESEPGKGSIFTVSLAAGANEHKSEKPSPTSVDQPLLPGHNLIVVIDDDPTVHDLLQRSLSQEGFQVGSAFNGHEGLRLVRQLRPDAILLDVMMPGMDGWSVLVALKNDPELAEIPVIMHTFMENKSMGYALGVSDYLTKPVDRERLVSVLRKYCRDNTCEKVLVVEDDQPTRELIRRLLEREGWSVAEAENGRVALDRLSYEQPELILLDLMMPEVDGFEFVSKLQASAEWHRIPVIVVTAKDITQEDRALLNGHVEKILQKGVYNREGLLLEIRRLVASYRNQQTVVST